MCCSFVGHKLSKVRHQHIFHGVTHAASHAAKALPDKVTHILHWGGSSFGSDLKHVYHETTHAASKAYKGAKKIAKGGVNYVKHTVQNASSFVKHLSKGDFDKAWMDIKKQASDTWKDAIVPTLNFIFKDIFGFTDKKKYYVKSYVMQLYHQKEIHYEDVVLKAILGDTSIIDALIDESTKLSMRKNQLKDLEHIDDYDIKLYDYNAYAVPNSIISKAIKNVKDNCSQLDETKDSRRYERTSSDDYTWWLLSKENDADYSKTIVVDGTKYDFESMDFTDNNTKAKIWYYTDDSHDNDDSIEKTLPSELTRKVYGMFKDKDGKSKIYICSDESVEPYIYCKKFNFKEEMLPIYRMMNDGKKVSKEHIDKFNKNMKVLGVDFETLYKGIVTEANSDQIKDVDLTFAVDLYSNQPQQIKLAFHMFDNMDIHIKDKVNNIDASLEGKKELGNLYNLKFKFEISRKIEKSNPNRKEKYTRELKDETLILSKWNPEETITYTIKNFVKVFYIDYEDELHLEVKNLASYNTKNEDGEQNYLLIPLSNNIFDSLDQKDVESCIRASIHVEVYVGVTQTIPYYATGAFKIFIQIITVIITIVVCVYTGPVGCPGAASAGAMALYLLEVVALTIMLNFLLRKAEKAFKNGAGWLRKIILVVLIIVIIVVMTLIEPGETGAELEDVGTMSALQITSASMNILSQVSNVATKLEQAKIDGEMEKNEEKYKNDSKLLTTGIEKLSDEIEKLTNPYTNNDDVLLEWINTPPYPPINDIDFKYRIALGELLYNNEIRETLLYDTTTKYDQFEKLNSMTFGTFDSTQ